MMVFEYNFAASPQQVYDMWTLPGHLKQWMRSPGTIMTHCVADLRVGGHLHYGLQAENGTMTWGLWVFEVLDAPNRLEYRVAFSDADGQAVRFETMPDWPLWTRSVLTFEPQPDGHTRMRLVWEPFEAQAHEESLFEASGEGMHRAWNAIFEDMQRVLDGLPKA